MENNESVKAVQRLIVQDNVIEEIAVFRYTDLSYLKLRYF